MHRMVIVGGGAGGLELVTQLGNRLGARCRRPKAHITLVDRSPTHLWKPLLHEVAAGSLEPAAHQLEYAAQARWHGFEFQLGELIALDRGRRIIKLSAALDEDGTELLPSRELAYDTLVIAIGSNTHFFGVAGAQEHALALDTVEQAERFQRRLLAACMRTQRKPAVPVNTPVHEANIQAAVAADKKRAAALENTAASNEQPRLQIVIVGGGATGVELSAELRNTAQVFAAYGLHQLDPQREIGIVIVEAQPRILSALSERMSQASAQLLRKLGIKLVVGERVESVSANSLRTVSGKMLRADLIVWAAGIKAPAVLSQLDGLATNQLGQLKVRATLQTESDDNIFALGDCASCPWLEQNTMVDLFRNLVARNTFDASTKVPSVKKGGMAPLRDSGRGPVPPRAQAAHQQASFLGRTLRRRLANKPLPTFRYRDLGSLVSLSRFSAVGNVAGGHLLIEGWLARFMYIWLYRLHGAALHGFMRMMLDTVASWLRRSASPRVKLH